MKILIIIESGIGNVIFLTPLIKALHKIYDKPKITLLSSRYRKEGKILEGWKYLKDCIYTANELDHNDFDKIFISPMYGSNFNHFLINVPKNKIFPLSCDRTIDWKREHEVNINMRIAKDEGFGDITSSTEVMIKSVKISLNKKKFKIGLHTGCLNHPDYAKKLWVNERWDNLAKRLEREFNAQIIWFGSKDKPYPEKIYEEDYSGKTGINLVGKFKDIRETAYVISKCDLFISIDSGLMHTANALNIPLIALFGPTLASKNSPWNDGSQIIQSKECKECYFDNLFRACKDNKCMKEITVDEIIETVGYITGKKKIKKICLVACRQLGDSLSRTLSKMKNVEFFKYDYLIENYNFSEKANECDLVLVLHGVRFNLKQLRKIKTKKILWFNDNIIRHKERFEEMIPYFDDVFTINKDNPRGIGFVPCGIDITQFKDLRLERNIDVSFIGNLYNGKRTKWLSKVKNYIDVSHFQDIDYDVYVNLLNRSKITINEHYNKYGANMRFYEAIACKSLMITDKVIGIPEDFKEGEHYLTYKDIPDLVKKIKYYLDNEEKRLKITEAAYEIAIERHKYSDRLNQLFKESRLR